MKTLSKEQISKFLAFTIWPRVNYININTLNNISLRDTSNFSIRDFKSELLKIFNNEIKSYNIIDWEKIGLLLSWGLDSTLLLELLKNHFPKSNIYTYTLWYNKNDPHLQISRDISEKYNTIHNEVIYDLDVNLLKTFDDIYSSWYDLEWEDSLIMNHLLSKEVEKDCKVVFSWFWLDYIFAGMDLFRNSFIEKKFNEWLVDKSFILKTLWLNKFYLKYILDKISNKKEDFFIKYWEYYGNMLEKDLEKSVKEFFYNSIDSIRDDISDLKKQIFFIINTSLSNRYNPYNVPYEKKWIKHYNPFWSINTIKEVIALNINDSFLLNPYNMEKKFIIRDIFRDLTWKDFINTLHSWTVLKYSSSIESNKNEILYFINNNRDFLEKYLSKDYLNVIDVIIKDSIWYENSKQIIIILQLLFYKKYNTSTFNNSTEKKAYDLLLSK